MRWTLSARYSWALTTYLNGFDMMTAAVQIVVIGDRSEAATSAMLSEAFGLAIPNRIVSVVAPGEELPATHPAAGKSQTDGLATAYVCVGTTCSLPVTDPAGLTDALPSP